MPRIFAVFLLLVFPLGANATATAYQAYFASTAPSWELLPAANSAYGTAEGLAVTRVQQVAPRLGWPAANLSQVAKMPAAAVRTAGTLLARSSGPLALALAAGAAVSWWLDDNGQLVKAGTGPAGQQPFSATGSYYNYCRNGACIWASSGTSVSALGAACANAGLCDWTGQTVVSYNCTGNIIYSVSCDFVYKVGNDGPYNWNVGFAPTHLYSSPTTCPGGLTLQAGMCSPGSSPVSDTDISTAVDTWAGSNAEAVRAWLKVNGKWSPGQYSYQPATQTIKSDPVTKTETVTAPNGQPQTATQQTRKFTNITCTADGCAVTAGEEVTRTNPDGSTEVSTSTAPQANSTSESAPSPNPTDIPDDYARENTLQDIRDKLEFDAPAQPEAETIASVLDAFKGRLAALPIVGAAFSLGNIGGSGQCPPISIELFQETIATEVHCELMETVTSMLSPVFSAIWLVLGLVIVLSA